MKYIIRILTLPFIWVYTILCISVSYIQYGTKCFTANTTKSDNSFKEVDIYIN
ncbi:MAG: hypothetical protein M0R17_04290 [Candidatus Omnitrophica bacterium]|jgi:hypothetical protein|nr:hypothetical protein [Candidatus Omnitrophota bacterium]